MRCKAAIACLLALLLAAGGVLAEESPEEDSPAETRGGVLVIYPEEADRRGMADNLSAIAQTLFSLRCDADFVEAQDAGEVIGLYEQVIWCATTVSERMDPAVLQDYEGALLMLGAADGLSAFGVEAVDAFAGSFIAVGEYAFVDELSRKHSTPVLNAGQITDAAYRSGTLSAAKGQIPMASGNGHRHYIALCDYTDAFSQAVLLQETAQWLWPYESRMHTYTEHVVLSPVYPFADPYRLRELVDYMVARKMVFTISVMPIYEHSDYPAMKQFCEVLRYAQANGGAVILHAPIVQNGVDAEELAEQLTLATMNYCDLGVYPLALEIPSAWLFREDLLPILGRYRTLFLTELDAFADQAVRDLNFGNYLRLGSQQVVPALRLDETGVSRVARCGTAVYLDMGMTEDERLHTVIEAARNAPIPMQSLWNMEQAVYLNDGHSLTWDQNTLKVDEAQRWITYAPTEQTERFNYRRNDYYRFVANLSNQNYFLISISAGVLILFLFLARRSRGQMHRRFLLKKTPETGEDQHVGS
ncbi:MAG: DUF2334 domain-containing protein [Clostridia bacterium]|nr:DUF2334 domain-containing protein [Clostridia bacterium]